jgi:L,D-peptidoglycan transpeptidase YkuD (ErfK/YbiS/YcfS/YnhG family)
MTDRPSDPSGQPTTRTATQMSRRRKRRLVRTAVVTALLLALMGFEIAEHISGSVNEARSSFSKTTHSPPVATTDHPEATPSSTLPSLRNHSAPPTTSVVTSLPVSSSTSTTAPATQQGGCPEARIGQPVYNGPGTQLITVDADSSYDTYAELDAWTRSGNCWQLAYGPFDTARLGYNGMSTDKHEGDGTTPEGIFQIGPTIYGNAPNPGVHAAYHNLVCGDWWDEDSDSPTYNTLQHVPCSETDPPFNNGSSEALWTETTAYPSFAVIEYNTARVPGAGSAIFLHADIGGPTDGCVSLPLAELDEVLDWIQPADNPMIDIGLSPDVLQP